MKASRRLIAGIIIFALWSVCFGRGEGSLTIPKVPYLTFPSDLDSANEGIDNDGSSFYFSGRQVLFKTDLDLGILVQNSDPLSLGQRLTGLNHLGDIAYYNGYIYAPIERQPIYLYPAIARYSASDLKLVEYKSQGAQHHMPWLAIDKTTLFIFSSEYDNVDELQIYDLNLDHRGSLPLSKTLPNGIQGGTFGPTPGLLYLTCNTNQSIWTVDILTGEVQQVDSYDQLDYSLEMEGITYLNLTSKGEGSLHFTGNPENSSATKRMFNLDIPIEQDQSDRSGLPNWRV